MRWTRSIASPGAGSSGGAASIFNGKLDSVHRGLDYRAKMRTPVAAINSGRVVLARPLYFEGGCVIIDHGLGLMSMCASCPFWSPDSKSIGCGYFRTTAKYHKFKELGPNGLFSAIA